MTTVINKTRDIPSAELYNADYRLLSEVKWTRALRLVDKGAAHIVESSGVFVHSPSQSVEVPSMLVLNDFVLMPQDKRSRVKPLTRMGVLRRDKFVCAYCNNMNGILEPCEFCDSFHGRAETIDHIVPKSRGGEHSWENLVAACYCCNGRKADRTPEEAGMQLRYAKPYVPSEKDSFAHLM